MVCDTIQVIERIDALRLTVHLDIVPNIKSVDREVHWLINFFLLANLGVGKVEEP